MAKNNVGVWPKNTIAGYMAEHQECSSNAQRAFDILGQRVDNLVYDEGVCTFKGDPYVIDAIFGSPDTTGIEIATAIKVLNPVVKPAESDGWVKLSCYDVINPFQIPAIHHVKMVGRLWTIKDMTFRSFSRMKYSLQLLLKSQMSFSFTSGKNNNC